MYVEVFHRILVPFKLSTNLMDLKSIDINVQRHFTDF